MLSGPCVSSVGTVAAGDFSTLIGEEDSSMCDVVAFERANSPRLSVTRVVLGLYLSGESPHFM